MNMSDLSRSNDIGVSAPVGLVHRAYLFVARAASAVRTLSVPARAAVRIPALTPPPALRPAPPLPVKHKYRVLAPGGYSIIASEVILSQRAGGGPCHFLPCTATCRAGLF